MRSHFILYVADQARSTRFYAAVLDQSPTLDVPGMTEFELAGGAVLGLMPRTGAQSLLGPRVSLAPGGRASAELYWVVEAPEAYHARALRAGAVEVSALQPRDWGHRASYCLDPDGHVLAFAAPMTAPSAASRAGDAATPATASPSAGGPVEKIDPRAKLAQFSERWSPKIIARVGDYHLKVAKLAGEFVWHAHAEEDELFLVLQGRLRLRFRDREVVVDPGEFIVVPRGIEHCPSADEEVHVLLFEPASTINTGDAGGERTRPAEWL